MSSDAELDTIVAPATPLGRSALAIVRIDGPRSGGDPAKRSAACSPDARIATLAQLRLDGEPLDECIAIRYAAPHSFTGNDLVELTLHGNPLLVERVIAAVVDAAARASRSRASSPSARCSTASSIWCRRSRSPI